MYYPEKIIPQKKTQQNNNIRSAIINVDDNRICLPTSTTPTASGSTASSETKINRRAACAGGTSIVSGLYMDGLFL